MQRKLRLWISPPRNLSVEAACAALERLMPVEGGHWEVEGGRLRAVLPVSRAIQVAVRLTEHQSVHLEPVVEGREPVSSAPVSTEPEISFYASATPLFVEPPDDEDAEK